MQKIKFYKADNSLPTNGSKSRDVFGYLGPTHQKRTHDVFLEAKIRSTQSIIYFLGEYLREAESPCEEEYPCTAKILQKNSKCQPRTYHISDYDESNKGPVFQVLPYSRNADALVTAKSKQKTYYIPAAKSENEVEKHTYNALTFLNQLINLRKSAEDRPSTINVRTVD